MPTQETATRGGESRHINAVKAFAGAGLMSAAGLSFVIPAVAVPLSLAAPSAIEIVGSLLAGLGAALWVERRPRAK